MNKYYVYMHINPETNEVFYIGKGCGKRAYEKYRNSEWHDYIKTNPSYNIIFVKTNLSEQEALELETSLIKEHSISGDIKLVNIAKLYRPVLVSSKPRVKREDPTITKYRGYKQELIEQVAKKYGDLYDLSGLPLNVFYRAKSYCTGHQITVYCNRHKNHFKTTVTSFIEYNYRCHNCLREELNGLMQHPAYKNFIEDYLKNPNYEFNCDDAGRMRSRIFQFKMHLKQFQ